MKMLMGMVVLLVISVGFSGKATGTDCGCEIVAEPDCNLQNDCGCITYNPLGQTPSCADRVEITPGGGTKCANGVPGTGLVCNTPGTKSVCYRTRACENGGTSWPSFCGKGGCSSWGVLSACVGCIPTGISNPWLYYDKRCING